MYQPAAGKVKNGGKGVKRDNTGRFASGTRAGPGRGHGKKKKSKPLEILSGEQLQQLAELLVDRQDAMSVIKQKFPAHIFELVEQLVGFEHLSHGINLIQPGQSCAEELAQSLRSCDASTDVEQSL